MPNYKPCPLLQLILVVLLYPTRSVTALRCADCGIYPVPYPLSTSSSCGDQLYKVRCTKGTLWLDTLNGSSYMIRYISPQNQRLIIRPKGFLADSCITTDIRSGGIWLNNSLPFKITDKNTFLKLNCTAFTATMSSMDCSSSSPCHAYTKGNEAAAAATRCSSLPYCCSYTTGGSQTAYKIYIAADDCSAYVSFVNLDASLPIRKWSEPGIEIQWELPREPTCSSSSECSGFTNSTCLPDKANLGQKRCLCNPGFQWDPISGICEIKCKGRKHCPHPINRRQLIKGLTIAASAILVIVLLLVLVHQHHQHIKREGHRKLVKQREEILHANNNGKTAKLFPGKEIQRATNHFSKQNLLGIGGFGEVFKGILKDGTLTAVKRAKPGNTMGMDQVLNEVRILCQVNHRSLVRLLGCCLDLEQPLLVYEYVPNGTLFDHLHGQYPHGRGTLSWQRRLFIAQQTADGLAYLHFSAVTPIFHRDIKSSNILLDENLDAKVSDFGLSRLIDTEASHISTCAQGTLGYLDPEYYQNFQLTDRSDVYSFGVVLLELLTSKKAIDFNRQDEDVNLVAHVSTFADRERLIDAVDPRIKKDATQLELETMKALGLLAIACVDQQRQNRPSMREVAEEIEYIISIILSLSRNPNILQISEGTGTI